MSETRLNLNTGGVSSVDANTSDKEDASTDKDESTLFTKGDKSLFTKEQLAKAHEAHPSLRGQMPDIHTDMERRPAGNSPPASQAMLRGRQQTQQDTHNHHAVDSAAQTRMASAADEPRISGVGNSVSAHETQLPLQNEKAASAGGKSQQEMLEKSSGFTMWYEGLITELDPKIEQCYASLRECIQHNEDSIRSRGPLDTPVKISDVEFLNRDSDKARGFRQKIDDKRLEISQIATAAFKLKKENGLSDTQLLKIYQESIEEKFRELHDIFIRCAAYGAYIDGYTSDSDDQSPGDENNTLFAKGGNSIFTREQLDNAHEARPNLRDQTSAVNTQYRADNSAGASQDTLYHHQQMRQNSHNDHNVDNTVQTKMASAADEPKSQGIENPYIDSEIQTFLKNFKFDLLNDTPKLSIDDRKIQLALKEDDVTPKDMKSLQEMTEECKDLLKRIHNGLSAAADEIEDRKESLRQTTRQKKETLLKLDQLDDIDSLDTSKEARSLRKNIGKAYGLINEIEDSCSELNESISFLNSFIRNGATPAQILRLCKQDELDQKIGMLKDLLNDSVLHEAADDDIDDAKIDKFMSLANLPQQELDEKANKFIHRINHEIHSIALEADSQINDLRHDAANQQIAIDEIDRLDRLDDRIRFFNPSLTNGLSDEEKLVKLAALRHELLVAEQEYNDQADDLYEEADRIVSTLKNVVEDMEDFTNNGGSSIQFLYEYPDRCNQLLSKLNDLLNLERPLIDIYDDSNLD